MDIDGFEKLQEKNVSIGQEVYQCKCDKSLVLEILCHKSYYSIRAKKNICHLYYVTYEINSIASDLDKNIKVAIGFIEDIVKTIIVRKNKIESI